MSELEELRAEVELHALANGGCIPKPAYDDLAAELRRVEGRRDVLLAQRDNANSRTMRMWERATAAESRLRAVEAALAQHPKACGVHPEDDVITCGWKRAVADVEQALA